MSALSLTATEIRDAWVEVTARTRAALGAVRPKRGLAALRALVRTIAVLRRRTMRVARCVAKGEGWHCRPPGRFAAVAIAGTQITIGTSRPNDSNHAPCTCRGLQSSAPPLDNPIAFRSPMDGCGQLPRQLGHALTLNRADTGATP